MMMMISNTAIATSTDSTIASATSIFFILENDDVHRGESDDVHHDAEDQDKREHGHGCGFGCVSDYSNAVFCLITAGNLP